MPEFGETSKGFKMKGWSPFTKKTDTDKRVFDVNQEKYDKWNKLKNRGKGPDVRHLGAKENKMHLDNYMRWKRGGAKFIADDGSPMKKKTDPPKGTKKKVKIKTKSPSETVYNLQQKQKDGTITDAESKKLKALQTEMETGPGSYGNEEWDKE